MIRNDNIDWHKIPFNKRQEMLGKAGLLDDKGRPNTKLTRRIKMMVIDTYYDPRESKVIIK